MTFAYYARLNRTQQAIYRKSDAITEVRLPRPADLHPLVAALEQALQSENRAATQHATERLIHGLTTALGMPAVRVEVLAARPHAKWGELHGLYTVTPKQPPKIQLWMRTAKQRRAVAFRTYLRTMLHEVGHHIDYAFLKLADSLHTEGFYKRESSLFHQLVPGANSGTPGEEDYAAWPGPEKLDRLQQTPSRLALLLRGRTDAILSRRPQLDAWSARDVVCHLRDAEQQFAKWIALVLTTDEPPLIAIGEADRQALEREYSQQHAGEAWNAFSGRRDETLARLQGLTPEQWTRAGRHAHRGRMTVEDLVALMAWHDDNHLDQIARALDGR